MKIRKKENTIYPERWPTAFLIFGSVLTFMIGYGNLVEHDRHLVFVAFSGFSLMCLFGALMHHFTTLTLGDKVLVLKKLAKRDEIEASRISKVTWEAGSGVMLRIDEMEWKKIPDFGNSQSVCNSIRAWLNRQAQPVASDQRR